MARIPSTSRVSPVMNKNAKLVVSSLKFISGLRLIEQFRLKQARQQIKTARIAEAEALRRLGELDNKTLYEVRSHSASLKDAGLIEEGDDE